MTEADCGEYVYLSPAHKSTNELESWLQQNKVNSACVSLSDIGWPNQGGGIRILCRTELARLRFGGYLVRPYPK
jgi:hypothetical protein